MSTIYRASFAARYKIPSILEQTEVAVIHAAEDILNEETPTPDHERWAKFILTASSQEVVAPFGWPIALNPTIAAAIEEDPNGATVADNDVQFVVNSYLDAVIEDWVTSHPA